SQLQLCELTFGEVPNFHLQSRLWDGSELECESDRILGQALWRGGDKGSAREVGSVQVRRKRDHEDRVENARQRVALPDYDRSTTGLFARAVWTEVCPPDLAAPQLRSSLSRVSAQFARPCSASATSSPFA